MWAGSDAGNVKVVNLRTRRLPGGGSSLWIEYVATLRWSDPHTLSARGVASPLRTSRRGFGDVDVDAPPLTPTGDPNEGILTLDGERCHWGRVHCMAAAPGRMFTAGGTLGHALLREWSSRGEPISSVDPASSGKISHPCLWPQIWDGLVQKQHGSRGLCRVSGFEDLLSSLKLVPYGYLDLLFRDEGS